MKKLMYYVSAIIIGAIIYSCTTENQDEKSSNIAEDLEKILNVQQGESSNTQSRTNLVIANEQNPFDDVGSKHNQALSILMDLDLSESNRCNSIMNAKNQLGANLNLSCQELTDIIYNGIDRSFGTDHNYNSGSFDILLLNNKISQNEYDIVNTTFENVYNISDINRKIELIKTAEDFTLNSEQINTIEKNRILRSFAIYRYSSDYWTNSNRTNGNDLLSSIYSSADAAGEYWAMNSVDSPAEDGSDIYFIGSVVSAVSVAIYLWP